MLLYHIFSSSMSFSEKIIYLTVYIIVLAWSLSIHEFMHAWVAEKMGDDTPRRQGRISLNPMAHIDPTGAILLLLAGFGWGKPVQINPNNLKRFKRWNCERLISLAGVFANFVMALISSLFFVFFWVYFRKHGASSEKVEMIQTIVKFFFEMLTEVNLGLMAFNLIPVPPLDGYRFVYTFIPYNWRQKFNEVVKYSAYIFLGLILLENFTHVDILSRIINWIETPFVKVIKLITDPLKSWLWDIL